MKNATQPSKGGYSEHNEPVVRSAEISVETAQDQIMLDYLFEMGFMWEEAVKLLKLRENLYENSEMHQRMTDDYRMHFARWLYEQGELKDE